MRHTQCPRWVLQPIYTSGLFGDNDRELTYFTNLLGMGAELTTADVLIIFSSLFSYPPFFFLLLGRISDRGSQRKRPPPLLNAVYWLV